MMVIVSWLDTNMKKTNVLVRKVLDGALTFVQMAACCQHNWTLMGNFPSRKARKRIFCIEHVKNVLPFSAIV